MATLRDVRKQAKALGLTYEKDTTIEGLEALIAAKMCETETVAVTRSPVKASPPATPPTPAAETTGEMPDFPAPETAAKPLPASVRWGDETPDFVKAAKINITELSVEFRNQATKFAVYAKAAAVAEARLIGAKFRLELVEAEMSKKFRTVLSADGAKPTEKAIQTEVLLSTEYCEAQESYIAAVEISKITKGAKETLAQRKDMLIQLGAAQRLEIECNGISMKEHTKAA